MFHVPHRIRIRSGPLASKDDAGNNGAFLIRTILGISFHVIASDGAGWQHVSVSHRTRCPSWNEMCFIKDMFWDPEDCAVQYHPARSQYVNNHAHCLHLWKPTTEHLPVPPAILVGVK